MLFDCYLNYVNTVLNLGKWGEMWRMDSLAIDKSHIEIYLSVVMDGCTYNGK